MGLQHRQVNSLSHRNHGSPYSLIPRTPSVEDSDCRSGPEGNPQVALCKTMLSSSSDSRHWQLISNCQSSLCQVLGSPRPLRQDLLPLTVKKSINTGMFHNKIRWISNYTLLGQERRFKFEMRLNLCDG